VTASTVAMAVVIASMDQEGNHAQPCVYDGSWAGQSAFFVLFIWLVLASVFVLCLLSLCRSPEWGNLEECADMIDMMKLESEC
jgi:hypothetical protein